MSTKEIQIVDSIIPYTDSVSESSSDKEYPNAKAVYDFVTNEITSLKNTSPETLEILNQIQEILNNDENLATAVATQIQNKADKTDVDGLTEDVNNHINNENNPHKVKLSDFGVDATANEINYVKGVKENIQQQIDNKANQSHSHSATDINNLSNIATSGDYKDLINQPIVPDDVIEVKKVDGNVVSVLNNVNSSLASLKVYGETKQKTTIGKNLLEYGTLTTKTEGGITFTPYYENGLLQYINVNGTSTKQVAYNISDKIRSINENLLISGCTGGNSSTYSLCIGQYDASDSWKAEYYQTNEDVASKTNYPKYNIAILVKSGVTLNNVKFYPMIRKVGADGTYEPYTGGIPSPNPDYPQDLVSIGDSGSFEVGVYGRNILENKATTLTANGVTFTTNEDKSVTVKGTSTTWTHLKLNQFILPKGNYIFSCRGVRSVVYGVILDAQHNIILDTYPNPNVDYALTLTEDTEIIAQVTVPPEATANHTIYPMLRLATETDNTYEPCNKQTLTMLGDLRSVGDVKDEVDFNRATHTRNVIDVFKSDFNIGLHQYTNNDYWVVTVSNTGVALSSIGLCSHLEQISSSDLGKKTGFYIYAIANGLSPVHISLPKTVASDITALKQWIIDNNMRLCYPLATPQETPLTQAELNAYRQIYINKPITTIISEANMEVEYVADSKTAKYIEQRFNECDDNITNTATGNVININSANAPLQNLKVYGKTTQDGTFGENVLPYPYQNSTQTINGVTFTDLGDGRIQIKGTATDYADFYLFNNIEISGLVEGRTYRIAGVDFSTTNVSYNVSLQQTNGAQVGFNLLNDESFKSVDTIATRVIAVLGVAKGKTVDCVVCPTLEVASVDLVSVGDSGSFEVGVYKSKNFVEITQDTKTSAGVTFTKNADNSFSLSGTCQNNLVHHIGRAYLVKGTSYKITGCASGGASNTYLIRVIYPDNSKNVEELGSGKTFTPTATGFFTVGIRVQAGTVTDGLRFYPMIRYSSVTDETYESGNIQTLTMPYTLRSDKLGVKDEIDFTRGVLIQRCTKLNNLVFKLYSTNTFVTDTTFSNSANSIFCNLYSSYDINVSGMPDKTFRKATAHHIYVRDTSFANVTEINNAYANGELEFIGELATPIEIPLTETELNAYRQLMTNSGNTTILSEADAEVTFYRNTPNGQATGNIHSQINKDYLKLQQAIITLGGTE